MKPQLNEAKSRASSVIVILFVIACLFSALGTNVSAASTVRGRLDRRYGYQVYPAANVRVTVYNPNIGRSSPAYTGNDGMYYFYNVPAGDYYLEVWVSQQPLVYTIRVYEQPFTDIPPILLP